MLNYKLNINSLGKLMMSNFGEDTALVLIKNPPTPSTGLFAASLARNWVTTEADSDVSNKLIVLLLVLPRASSAAVALKTFEAVSVISNTVFASELVAASKVLDCSKVTLSLEVIEVAAFNIDVPAPTKSATSSTNA